VAVVAGSATDVELFRELKRDGIDFFITGEPKYAAFHMAKEFGLNIFYGGHYQTETFGIKALGEHLQRLFAIPVVFMDTPCIF
jgi:putative NIF3 family GTP cyclohydrolase 1 type 2